MPTTDDLAQLERLVPAAPCLVPVPGKPFWALSRYADVRAALTNPRFSMDARWTMPPELGAETPPTPTPMMILMDPPEHTRLRRLVSRSFTAQRMEELRPRVTEIAAELLAALPPDGTVDLMARYAFPLSFQVICELLSVPMQDRDAFSTGTAVMISGSTAVRKAVEMVPFTAYLNAFLDRKRAEPDDALLSGLIAVRDDDGDRLSKEELIAMVLLLLFEGHETTANLIGSGAFALLTHREQFVQLRERPELLSGAVEEFLRWGSSVVNTVVRFTSSDVAVAGVTIPAGSTVVLCLTAANRDPDRFPDAAAFDVTRDASGHVAFGHGLHLCLGARLAQIQGEVALGALLAERPELTLAMDSAASVRGCSMPVRGMSTLPVKLGTRA